MEFKIFSILLKHGSDYLSVIFRFASLCFKEKLSCLSDDCKKKIFLKINVVKNTTNENRDLIESKWK